MVLSIRLICITTLRKCWELSLEILIWTGLSPLMEICSLQTATLQTELDRDGQVATSILMEMWILTT